MQRVKYMASGLRGYAVCYIFVCMHDITVKTVFFIFLLYVIRVYQSLISMQTDDDTGQLSAERAYIGLDFQEYYLSGKRKNELI